MLNQNNFFEKLQEVKGGFKSLWKKFHLKRNNHHASHSSAASQTDIYEFTPDDQVSTSPRVQSPLSNASSDAQDLVWDNEDASMQDKSYSFDEETTKVDYESDTDDDLWSEQERR
jgi:hypothetical protein